MEIKRKNLGYLFVKRLFDIIMSLIGCILLIPIALFVKLGYIFTGDFRPILYSQFRIGRNGKLFKIYKFRSMIWNAEDELERLMRRRPRLREEYEKNKKLSNDPRVTKVGKFIRHYSIDETPQFLNVLLGHMSVIGNRPYLVREKKEMGKYYQSIIRMRPGITGFWQVYGHNDVSFKGRLELESTYADIASLRIDAGIFCRTVAVFLGLGRKTENK